MSCRKTTESCSLISFPASVCWDAWPLTTASPCSQGRHLQLQSLYYYEVIGAFVCSWQLEFRNYFGCCHVVTSSCSLLEDRVTRLHGQLQRTQQHLMASSDPGSVDRKVLDDLYEDIHWLILVSGQDQDINHSLFVSLRFYETGILGFLGLEQKKNCVSVGRQAVHF